jgi:hypothetical protein
MEAQRKRVAEEYIVDQSQFPAPYSPKEPPYIPGFKGFVSSKIKGLEKLRASAVKVLEGCGCDPIHWEGKMGAAQERQPRQAWLDGLRQSDFYIGIFSKDYSAPTEQEHQEASQQTPTVSITTLQWGESRDAALKSLEVHDRDAYNSEYNIELELKPLLG